jgi:arylsulfatase A-like enzyme
VKRFGHDSGGGLRGMKADAWEAGHRMPFLARWPRHVKPGTVSDHTLCFTDLLSTFAELTGTDLPEGAGPDSESFFHLLPLEAAGGFPPRAPIVMQSGGGAMMIRDGAWKLIDQLGSGGFSKPKRIQPGPGDPPGQLYNLAADPAERNNLWAKHPEIVARLTTRMKEIAAE